MTTRWTTATTLPAALAVCAAALAGTWGCQGEDRAAAADAPAPAIASSPEAAAVVGWEGERVLGVPAYPGAEPATGLRDTMRVEWMRAGEPEALFDVKLGERILVTDDPLPMVREFYLPFVHKVFMDHEMEFPDVGSQEMFTGLIVAPDGALVKFTATHPFFRYPDQEPIERTVIQLGRVGRRN